MAQEKAEVMGTDANRILVLDANIMLRAVLGTRVRSLIERYGQRTLISSARAWLPGRPRR